MNIPKGKENKPGWWQIPESDEVFLRCGQGHVGTLGDHSVTPDGRVVPSLECPRCGWHVMGKLVDWNGGHR